MLKMSKNTANPDRAGGCCCSGKKNSAEVAEAVKETIPASEPANRTAGRDEEAASCCQSSKEASPRKGEHDEHRP